MKKIVLILIAVTMLFTACNSNTGPTTKHDFRDIDFGMSTVELFEIEGEPDDEFVDDDFAEYTYENKEAFGIKNVLLEYRVTKNGVCYARADFQNEYADNKSYITEYNAVKKNLISVWGEPENISENDEELHFSCNWENKSLSLHINLDGKAFFELYVFNSEYLEYTQKLRLELHQSATE